MFRRRCLEAQGLHQESLIHLIESCHRPRRGARQQSYHDPVVPGAVGKDQELVISVKPQQFAAAPHLRAQGIAPFFHYEAALDEVFTELGVVKPLVILNGDEREVFHKDAGEDPLSPSSRLPFFMDAMDPYPLRAAAR